MTRPGCLLVFGVYLAHRSGPNKTDSPRKAVYLTYNQATEGDLRDHYYGEKRRLFPPISDREEGKDYSEGAVIYNLTTPITEQGLYRGIRARAAHALGIDGVTANGLTRTAFAVSERVLGAAEANAITAHGIAAI
ncbi:hypothetical protein BG005_008752 [Podila minutissima]|nr:hypothetical protein BG005_008752 [Podila minutissima]